MIIGINFFDILDLFMEISGLEPLTSALQKQRYYQLSYIPQTKVGYAGLEPATLPLSGVRSNHLS